MHGSHSHRGQLVPLAENVSSLPVPDSDDDGAVLPPPPTTTSALLLFETIDGSPVLAGPVEVYARIGPVTWYLAETLRNGADITPNDHVRIEPSPFWERLAVAAAGGVTGGNVTVTYAIEELQRDG